MKLSEIAKEIESIVPLELALDWDNVGLLVGDAGKDVKKILMTIDTTKEVVAEAKKLKSDLILSYHPVIWDGLKKVVAGVPGSGAIVHELIRNDIAVFSVHTAMDIVCGGVNDGLAEMVGIVDAEPIGDFVENPAGDNYKLAVFVPIESAAKVANALFAAGAGAIGNYSDCGFSSEGSATFKPLNGARPAVGKKGSISKVKEVRFETIVPADKIEGCISAMKEAHPYEVPACDCIKLHHSAEKMGLGRIGMLGKPAKINEIVERIKKVTGAETFGIVGSEKGLVKKAAVCAGTCGKIINDVINQGCDLYVTGELKHHEALAAQQAGVTCICLSHTVSERFILKKLGSELKKSLTNVTISISKKDADPFNWKKYD